MYNVQHNHTHTQINKYIHTLHAVSNLSWSDPATCRNTRDFIIIDNNHSNSPATVNVAGGASYRRGERPVTCTQPCSASCPSRRLAVWMSWGGHSALFNPRLCAQDALYIMCTIGRVTCCIQVTESPLVAVWPLFSSCAVSESVEVGREVEDDKGGEGGSINKKVFFTAFTDRLMEWMIGHQMLMECACTVVSWIRLRDYVKKQTMFNIHHLFPTQLLYILIFSSALANERVINHHTSHWHWTIIKYKWHQMITTRNTVHLTTWFTPLLIKTWV